jgi:GGDEF domain-containing protein
MRSVPIWLFYIVFATLYSLWALRLTRTFFADRRLGYILVLTDSSVLLPLAAWSSGVGMKAFVLLACAGGLAVTLAADSVRQRRTAQSNGIRSKRPDRAAASSLQDPRLGLETAIRLRLQVYQNSGARFGLVILRITRFEELSSYYGEDTSQRLLASIGRRGIRLLGQDAQRFPLPGGRVAFLFETERAAERAARDDGMNWSDPCDVEGLAMTLGRRVCEHLIEGQRVECVVGWASAPVDGLSANDLAATAEEGAHSTAAFRRVSGSRVAVRIVSTSGPSSSRVPQTVPEHARTAVG